MEACRTGATACLLIGVLAMTGCFIPHDEPTRVRHIAKDFNLAWWFEPRNQEIFWNTDSSEYGGGVVVKETVFAVGHNEEFIIAMQHPNNDDTISWDNIHEHETWPLDSIPSDTLPGQRSYVKVNGRWLGISNGRNTHPELFPDKKVTYWHILDIRGSEDPDWSWTDHLYSYDKQESFHQKREELGVPVGLEFSIVDTSLR